MEESSCVKKCSNISSARPKTEEMKTGRKTALDVAKELRDYIKTQYPGFQDADAMRLATLLTKEEVKKKK